MLVHWRINPIKSCIVLVFVTINKLARYIINKAMEQFFLHLFSFPFFSLFFLVFSCLFVFVHFSIGFFVFFSVYVYSQFLIIIEYSWSIIDYHQYKSIRNWMRASRKMWFIVFCVVVVFFLDHTFSWPSIVVLGI